MIVANTRAIVPDAVMSCRVVGVLVMEDEAGGDEKLLAVPSAKLTQRYAHVNNYSDLPSITIQQIEHFFAHYKDLEPNKWVKIVRWGDADEARALVLEGIQRAKRFCCKLCCWRTSRMRGNVGRASVWVWVIVSRGGSSQLRRSFGPCDGI